MARVYYNKLIRDKIPEKISRKGEECAVRRLEDNEEFEQELLKKVEEEARALSMVRTREDLLAELSDLRVVLDAVTEAFKISEDELAEAQAKNLKEKGGFNERCFLHWSSDAGYASNETVQGIAKK